MTLMLHGMSEAILILKEGQMVNKAAPKRSLQNPIADYTKELIEAIHLGWG